MPNWCECDLQVIGEKRRDVVAFSRAVECRDDESVFKIANLVPIPDGLTAVQAGTNELFFDSLYGSEEQLKALGKTYKVDFSSNQEAFEHIAKLYGKDVAEAKALAEQYKLNVAEHGHATWYSWCITNWGTKWDANEPDRGRIEKAKSGGSYRLKYSFTTAWSPPLAALGKMSEQFPDLKFKLRYFECGCGFQGKYIVKGGMVLVNETKDYSGRRGG